MSSIIDAASRPNGRVDVCQTVITEVAAAKDVPPEELEQTLYDIIDPDALERLFGDRHVDTGRQLSRVEFTFAGCRVTVRGRHEVSVSTLDDVSAADAASGAAMVDERNPS